MATIEQQGEIPYPTHSISKMCTNSLTSLQSSISIHSSASKEVISLRREGLQEKRIEWGRGSLRKEEGTTGGRMGERGRDKGITKINYRHRMWVSVHNK